MEIWSYEHMVYAQIRIHPGELDAQNSLPLWDTNISFNPEHKNRLNDRQQKKNMRNRGLCLLLVDQREKIKENKEKDKYIDRLISARWPVEVITNKKKKRWPLIDFALPADDKVNLKEIKKRDKYVKFSRKLKSTEHKKETDITI